MHTQTHTRAHLDAVDGHGLAVGVGPRHVEGADAADLAEEVPRGLGAKLVCCWPPWCWRCGLVVAAGVVVLAWRVLAPGRRLCPAPSLAERACRATARTHGGRCVYATAVAGLGGTGASICQQQEELTEAQVLLAAWCEPEALLRHHRVRVALHRADAAAAVPRDEVGRRVKLEAGRASGPVAERGRGCSKNIGLRARRSKPLERRPSGGGARARGATVAAAPTAEACGASSPKAAS